VQPLGARQIEKRLVIESGSTSGVSANISCRTSRPTREYLSMSGRTTRACGHNRSASNIGIADRTP